MDENIPPIQIPPELLAQFQAQQEARKRAAECMAEIQAVLEKHHCRIEPVVTIDSRGTRTDWGVSPVAER
jgi:hypothetical protein